MGMTVKVRDRIGVKVRDRDRIGVKVRDRIGVRVRAWETVSISKIVNSSPDVTRDLSIYDVNFNDATFETNQFFMQNKENNFYSLGILNTVVIVHKTSPRPF